MITLDNLTKVFETANGPVVAADHINMHLEPGETCILLGPSGCGKTTTLKMVNRLIPLSAGRILIDGKDTAGLDTTELRRSIGYVIQQIGLFPNMTVEQNIGVVPQLLGWDEKRTAKRAHELLEMVALDPAVFARRYPRELSGGQQQRVGVARALAADPPVMLMDEPFGAIDPINREVIQDQFLLMQAELKKTIMFVSHDIDEAVKMGDKVAIFRGGKLEQFDSPDNILAHPANEFIADFVGSDRTLKRLRLVKVAAAVDGAVPSVVRSDNLAHAADLMRDHEREVAVVLDADRRPVGYLHAERAQGRSGTAGDHLEPLGTRIAAASDLRTAVSEMFTHDVTWLAVTDDQGRYAGCITQSGITHLLGETYRRPAAA